MAQLDALAAAVFPPAPPPPGPAFMQTSVALEHRREVRRPGARARTQGRPPPDPGARPVRLSPAAMPRHDTAVAHDDAPPWGPVPISTAGPSSGGFPSAPGPRALFFCDGANALCHVQKARSAVTPFRTPYTVP